MDAKTFPPIPVETARVARAVFGRSNFYLATGDHIDGLFAGLSPEDPALRFHNLPGPLAILYLITIFQYIETLPDLQAIDAVRQRVDWKYALHLPLNYPCLEIFALCEFRKLCLVNQVCEQNFQSLLSRLPIHIHPPCEQLLKQNTREVIIRVCMISRLAKIWEALNHAIEALASKRPEWLLDASLPYWYERYGHRSSDLNLGIDSLQQQTLAQIIGHDGAHLLNAISSSNLPELKNVPEVLSLQKVWQEQYWQEEEISWRKTACASCSVKGSS